jgi:hypothetical protein
VLVLLPLPVLLPVLVLLPLPLLLPLLLLSSPWAAFGLVMVSFEGSCLIS